MEGLEKIFFKLLEEKNNQKQAILKEAQNEKLQILKDLEEEAKKYFEGWFKKKKDSLLRRKQDEVFNLRLNYKKGTLLEKEKILKESFEKVEEFLLSHREFLPKKELVTKKDKKEVDIDLEDFLTFLKSYYAPQIEEFFPF